MPRKFFVCGAQPLHGEAQSLHRISAKIRCSIFGCISEAGNRIWTGPGTNLRVTVFLRIMDDDV